MGQSELLQNVQDGMLASGLISAPAWTRLLGNLNEVLTAMTLFTGLVLGLVSLFFIFKGRSKAKE